MADTLKFGPEWLRQLSGGNSVSTPPPSPAPGFGKYKLAEYRYGREEMLALFTPSQKMPEELAEFSAIITEKGQDPLALLPFTEEEQRITSQSVNSQAVLRMMGRGAPPLRGRGGGFERGRGRGRGRGDGFMQRGLSYDEGEGGGFGRPRGPRPEGWEEMGQKRFERPFPTRFDDTGNPPNPKMYQRSLSNENWRDREEDDDDGDWRKAGGSKWNTHTRGSWRDGRGERGFEYDRNPNIQKGFSRQYQRSRSSESWEEEEMPEWSTDGDMDELGTFDASGAFVSKDLKPPLKGRRPPGDKDHEETEGEEKKPSNSPETTRDSQKQHQKTQKDKPPEKNNSEEKDINENHMKKVDNKKSVKNSESLRQSPKTTQPSRSSPRPVPPKETEKDKEKDKPKLETPPKEADKSKSPQTVKETKAKPVIVNSETKQLNDKPPVKKAADKTEKSINSAIQKENKVPENSNSASVVDKKKAKQKSEAEALDQLQETVETMVAGMTVEEDELKEEEVVVPQTPTAGALPQDHENYSKWFYRDPQGDLQGPFTSKEMAEWFSAGYFTMTLQVRRGCDEVFSPLGELIKRWGRVPFLPGQSPPPAVNKSQPSREPTQQQQQQRRDQEQMQALQNFLFQQQLAQQQQIIRQLQLQQIQQMVVTLQENEEVKSLPLIQQQQLAMQMLLKHPQQLVMNQQPLTQQKLSPRSPEPESPANPTTSQPSFPTSFNQEPSSIWDIEPSKTEQDNELQARRQKEQEEKDEYERRFKQKEEELKKRLEEMEREKQEVEKKKLELQRLEEEKKKQEDLERKREEEKRRQLEEERKKKEEEKRRREEEIRRQQELERQQEIKRQQELQKQQEAQRLKEQEEIEKQKQLEIQRRQEVQRQQELQQQESLRKQQQDALHKLQQEQMASMQLPSHAQWGSNQASIPVQGQKSLLEIQQQEELERQEMEKMQRQQAELQRQQLLALQQEQQQQQKSWTNSFIKPHASPTKSLLEIQDEQARQLERERQKREENHQQVAKNMSLGTASVWSTSPNISSNWANDGAWGAIKQSAQMNKSNNNSNSLGFWDDAIISTSAVPPPSKKQSGKQEFYVTRKPSADFPALGGGPGNKSKQSSQAKQKPSKSRKEEEAVQRLFQSVKPTDDFTEWCERQLRNMDTSVDIPTFIAFLQEVESPYEVYDYVRSYLGESKSATEFAKSFLEKRSQFKNKGRPIEEDSIWGPAPAITPRELRQPITEENQKGKGGKKKKNRMMKLDSSILGFTVHAAPDRIVGEIDSEVSGGSAR